MKKLEHFKKILEANKEIKLSELEQLTITKEGNTEVHTASNGKTVEEAESDKDSDEKPKTKKESDKSKGKNTKDESDSDKDIEKED